MLFIRPHGRAGLCYSCCCPWLRLSVC